MEGATTEEIITTVEACPSGALSWSKVQESDDRS